MKKSFGRIAGVVVAATVVAWNCWLTAENQWQHGKIKVLIEQHNAVAEWVQTQTEVSAKIVAWADAEKELNSANVELLHARINAAH